MQLKLVLSLNKYKVEIWGTILISMENYLNFKQEIRNSSIGPYDCFCSVEFQDCVLQ